jgi:hypothetical protein
MEKKAKKTTQTSKKAKKRTLNSSKSDITIDSSLQSTLPSKAEAGENVQVTSDVKNALNEQAALKKDIEEVRKDNLTILSIFVAFLTFFSIEIKILQFAARARVLVGLSSLTLGGIMLFVIMLSNVIKERNEWSWKLFSPLFVLSLILLMISMLCFLFPYIKAWI